MIVFQCSKHLKQLSIWRLNLLLLNLFQSDINPTKPDHCHQKPVQDYLSYTSISYLRVSDVSTSAFKQVNILLFVEIDRFRRSYCCRLSFTFSSSESLLNYSDVRAPPVFVCWFMCLFVLRLMFLSASDKEISADLQKLDSLSTFVKSIQVKFWLIHRCLQILFSILLTLVVFRNTFLFLKLWIWTGYKFRNSQSFALLIF